MKEIETLRAHIESMPRSYSKSCYIDLLERYGKQYKFYCKYGIMPKTWMASVKNGVSLLNRLHDDIMGGENGIA